MSDMAWNLRVECNKICNTARVNKWKYGDSKTLPPCNDNVISCDRLIARALYNLGYTDQPVGGITVLNMDKYLINWGFKKIISADQLTHGDIVLMGKAGESEFTANWHTFLLDQFWTVQDIYKYDCGDQWRIESEQPFAHIPLNQWGTAKYFYAGYRLPNEKRKRYKIISAINPDYVLDVNGGKAMNGNNVQLYQDNGTIAQRFYIEEI